VKTLALLTLISIGIVMPFACMISLDHQAALERQQADRALALRLGR
jgi:hypothetical protein